MHTKVPVQSSDMLSTGTQGHIQSERSNNSTKGFRLRTAETVAPCAADQAQADPCPHIAVLRSKRCMGNAAQHLCWQRRQLGGRHAGTVPTDLLWSLLRRERCAARTEESGDDTQRQAPASESDARGNHSGQNDQQYIG